MKKLIVIMVLALLMQALPVESLEETLTGGGERYWSFVFRYYYDGDTYGHLYNDNPGNDNIVLFREDHTFVVFSKMYHSIKDHFVLRPDPALRIGNWANMEEGRWEVRHGRLYLFYLPIPIVISNEFCAFEIRRRPDHFYDDMVKVGENRYLQVTPKLIESYTIKSIDLVSDPVAKTLLDYVVWTYEKPDDTTLLIMSEHDYRYPSIQDSSFEKGLILIDCTPYMKQQESLLRYEGSEDDYPFFIPETKESVMQDLLLELEYIEEFWKGAGYPMENQCRKIP